MCKTDEDPYLLLIYSFGAREIFLQVVSSYSLFVLYIIVSVSWYACHNERKYKRQLEYWQEFYIDSWINFGSIIFKKNMRLVQYKMSDFSS